MRLAALNRDEVDLASGTRTSRRVSIAAAVTGVGISSTIVYFIMPDAAFFAGLIGCGGGLLCAELIKWCMPEMRDLKEKRHAIAIGREQLSVELEQDAGSRM